ncbi:MAG TPA: TldD/PmbA family protein [Polyangiaceae bacterium]|jgi:TldD protein
MRGTRATRVPTRAPVVYRAVMLTRDEESAMRAALERLERAPDVRYAEVRFVSEEKERLRVRDGRPEEASTATSRGVGIRVLGEKTWGFACTADLSEAALVSAAERAARIAKASGALTRAPVSFPARAASRGTYETRVLRDPFAVPLDEKMAALDAPVRALLRGGKPVSSANAWMEWVRVEKRLLTTEGTDTTQRFTYGGAGMEVHALGDDGVSQRRSYPTWQGSEGFQGGWEKIADLDLVGHAGELRDEAVALLSAPPCPEGVRDLILDASQVALQIHESCGHPTELDRAQGSEISLAGGSFMQPRMLGNLRYGSELVDIVADSTAEGGMGTFGWDDEGVAAGKHALIERGMFVDYLSSRETAHALGRDSTGTMRADGWNRTPLIRMVNVSIAPKKGSFDDLVADTKDGIYMLVDKSWSIDDLRLNFQFSCEAAWEIKNGKKTRLLRDPRYTGITPELWRSCDAICGPEEWKLFGLSTCGKGDPMQIMQVGHGASPARFRKVSIGNTGGKS